MSVCGALRGSETPDLTVAFHSEPVDRIDYMCFIHTDNVPCQLARVNTLDQPSTGPVQYRQPATGRRQPAWSMASMSLGSSSISQRSSEMGTLPLLHRWSWNHRRLNSAPSFFLASASRRMISSLPTM